MVGALNKLPIAVFGMVFFEAVVSFASISSIIIGILIIYLSICSWCIVQLCQEPTTREFGFIYKSCRQIDYVLFNLVWLCFKVSYLVSGLDPPSPIPICVIPATTLVRSAKVADK